MKTSIRFLTAVVLTTLLSLMGWQTLAAQAIRPAAPTACTPGPHSGTISSDQIWCAGDNVHVVDGDLTVSPDVTLTLEPGVIVKFYLGVNMTVNGTLRAEGASDQNIVLTWS